MVFSSPAQISPKRGSLVHTIPILGREWRVSLYFKPTDYSHNKWASLLHLTIGEDNRHYGSRYPGVWFHPKPGICFVSAVNKEKNYAKCTLEDRPKLGGWTSLQISQEQAGGSFVYKIVIGDKELHSVENTKPVEMKAVKVYASDPWSHAQRGSIKALLIQTKLGQCHVMLL